MEPKNDPNEKVQHLNQTFMFGFHVGFGVIFEFKELFFESMSYPH